MDGGFEERSSSSVVGSLEEQPLKKNDRSSNPSSPLLALYR
jgi:hypothetical protein